MIKKIIILLVVVILMYGCNNTNDTLKSISIEDDQSEPIEPKNFSKADLDSVFDKYKIIPEFKIPQHYTFFEKAGTKFSSYDSSAEIKDKIMTFGKHVKYSQTDVKSITFINQSNNICWDTKCGSGTNCNYGIECSDIELSVISLTIYENTLQEFFEIIEKDIEILEERADSLDVPDYFEILHSQKGCVSSKRPQAIGNHVYDTIEICFKDGYLVKYASKSFGIGKKGNFTIFR